MTGQSWFGFTVAVEIAWGADLTADSGTWSWTDITDDVRQDPGISTNLGRSDEASKAQPASCTVVVNNTTGDYSLGGESSNYPNVRKGTPLRVRMDAGSGLTTIFFGFVARFQPSWADTERGTIPTVTIEASGTLRRLEQGASPVESAFRRALSTDTHCVGYWPMEDGKLADEFAPAVGTNGMVWRDGDEPNLSSNTAFVGSDSLPVLNGAQLSSAVGYYTTDTGYIVIRLLAQFPESGESSTTFLSVYLQGGSLGRVDFTYNSATTSIDAAAFDHSGGTITLLGGPSIDLGSARRYSFEIIQSGSDVQVSWLSAPQYQDAGSWTDMTVTGYTTGIPTWIVINPLAALNQVAVGHVAVLDGYTFDEWVLSERAFEDGDGYMSAWTGEYADSRIARLAEEQGETVMVVGDSDMRMGPQSIGTLLDLMRECETVDQGVLYDGLDAGLTYVCRTEIENRSTDLTIDASVNQLAPPFEAVDDDQRVRNKATVTRSKGVTATYEDATGPLGTEVIGTYDTSLTVNHADDSQMEYFAQWLVHLGTVEGYRHPAVSLDVRRTSSLAATALGLMPTHRIDVTNPRTALTAHPGATERLLVEGLSHRIGGNEWKCTAKCSPFDPWQLGTISPQSSGAAIDYMGAGILSTASTLYGQAAFTPQIPPGADHGDLLLLFACVRNSGTGTINTPDDWTVLASSGNCSLFGRFMRPGEPRPVVSVANAAVNEVVTAQMVAFRGVHPDIDNCVHASATQLNASAANIAYPALTVSADNCAVLVFGWKQDDWTSVATLSGMTEMFDSPTTSGNDAGIVGDYVIQTSHANIAASSFTVTGGAAAISRAITIALKPATAPSFPLRLDTAGSTLASSISAGATSMSVATTEANTITYVGIGAASFGDNASLTPALPASVAAGDLMLIMASIRNSGTGTVNTPAGWRALLTTGNVTILGRFNRSGDAAPTVTFSGGAAGDTTIAQCFAYRGTDHDITSVLHATNTQLNGSAQNIAYPALTVTQDGCAIIVAGWKQDDWTSVAPIAFEISDSPTTTGNDAGHVIDYVIQTTAANISSGTFTVTGGASAISRALVFAIKPYTGCNWTTSSANYPFDLDVGGVKITATACSGSHSPQTMTINAAPVARTSGAAVKLWRPPVPGR